jgi:transcriptional regulator with XRE-family HTH domain
MTTPKKPPDKLKEVGRRLRTARLALGLDQQEMADALTVARTTYSNWEVGIRPPESFAMARLEERFGVTMSWIFLGDLRGLPYELATRVLAQMSPSSGRDNGARGRRGGEGSL